MCYYPNRGGGGGGGEVGFISGCSDKMCGLSKRRFNCDEEETGADGSPSHLRDIGATVNTAE